MNRTVLLSVVLSLSAWGAVGAADEARWQTYRDARNGFEFRFPASMKLEARFASGDLKEVRTGRTILSMEVWPPDECTHAPGEKTVSDARKVALQRAEDLCQADGPDGPSFCTDPVTVHPFASKEGARGFEIYLTRAGEHCDTDDDGDCVGPVKREVYGRKGPVYAFDISTDAMTKILYVEPMGAEPAVFVPGSKADPKVVREILSTLKVFKVESPRVNCIQDLPPGQGFALPSRARPSKPPPKAKAGGG